MADFGIFKFTQNGLDLEYKAQMGKELQFTKFVLGDGYYTGDVRELTSLVNVIREEDITRFNIQNTTDSQTGTLRKKVQIGFTLETADITTGFYMREIGLYAEDPDTHQEVLALYANAGDTADYIAPAGSSTITQKLQNINLYFSDTENITVVIDTSLIYATQEELSALEDDLEGEMTAFQETVSGQISDLDDAKADKKQTWQATLLASGWSASAPYTQTISVTGLKANDIINIYPIYSNLAETRASEKEEYSKLSMVVASANSITVYCDEEKPTIDLNVRMEVFN